MRSQSGISGPTNKCFQDSMQRFAKLVNCFLGVSWEIYPKATLLLSASWHIQAHPLFRYLKSPSGPRTTWDASQRKDSSSSTTLEMHPKPHIIEFLITYIASSSVCLQKAQSPDSKRIRAIFSCQHLPRIEYLFLSIWVNQQIGARIE